MGNLSSMYKLFQVVMRGGGWGHTIAPLTFWKLPRSQREAITTGVNSQTLEPKPGTPALHKKMEPSHPRTCVLHMTIKCYCPMSLSGGIHEAKQ